MVLRTLKFVAEVLGGELIVSDDGLLIEVARPFLSDEKTVTGCTLIFDFEGKLRTIQYHDNKK